MDEGLFAGTVGSAEIWRTYTKNGANKTDLVAVCKTLTESTINISTTQDEIRGGTYGPVQYTFQHDPTGTVTLTEITWKPAYIEMQLGGHFSDNANSESYYSEEVIATAAALPLKYSVQAFKPSCGSGSTYAVAYAKVGSDDWATAEATGDKFNSVSGTFTAGDHYCVRYCRANHTEAAKLVVSAHIVPGEYRLIIRAPLFAGTACAASKGSNVGEVQYVVPRFKLDGQLNLTMAMSSNQTQSISGKILSSDAGCGMDGGTLCEIIKVIKGDQWYDKGVSLEHDADLKVAAGEPLGLYLAYSDGGAKEITSSEISYINCATANTVDTTNMTWGTAVANNTVVNLAYANGALNNSVTGYTVLLS